MSVFFYSVDISQEWYLGRCLGHKDRLESLHACQETSTRGDFFFQGELLRGSESPVSLRRIQNVRYWAGAVSVSFKASVNTNVVVIPVRLK